MRVLGVMGTWNVQRFHLVKGASVEKHFKKIERDNGDMVSPLRDLLNDMTYPFRKGAAVGIKLHWGEKGNRSYLPPVYAKEIVSFLKNREMEPFIFDTTVLYSGGRRNGSDALKTAAGHGYTLESLGCPIVIADGMDGRDVVDLAAGFKHFQTVQVASLVKKTKGFLIFSHFKGHLASGFGGAIKNLSMGFASRAHKQRMHADVRPILNRDACTQCGVCIEVCPSGAAQFAADGYPIYDHELCIGCAQCIGLCPEVALQIVWETDMNIFQEKLVETAAAVWNTIKSRTVLVNAMLNVTKDCDCLPGHNPKIAPDAGFVGGYHPVSLDQASLEIVGTAPIDKTYPYVPWRRQFTYAQEIGFSQ